MFILELLDEVGNTISKSNLTYKSTSGEFVQLVYIGNLLNNGNVNNHLKIKVNLNTAGSKQINLNGTVKIYSYSQILPPSKPYFTGPTGPVSINPTDFALRFINYDAQHSPTGIGIFFKNSTGVGYHINCVGGNSIEDINPTDANVSQLFFGWDEMNKIDNNDNIREIVLGGVDAVYNSGLIFITKTPLTYDSNFKDWKTSPSNGDLGPPVNYYNEVASNLTLDVMEFNYNFIGNGVGGQTGGYVLNFNTTNVDAFSIPMTLSMVYKEIDGARRVMNGPLGIEKSSNTIFNEFIQEATGTDFFQCLVPPYTGSRLIAPEHAHNASIFNSYTNDYVTEFWDTWASSTLTFYPSNTGAGSGWVEATLSTTGPITGVGPSSVASINSIGATPASFQIQADKMFNKGLDLYSNNGVWISASGVNAGTEKAIKAELAASLSRGVASNAGDRLGTFSYITGEATANTLWNDYLNKGKEFYKNTDPHIYGKIIHNNVNISSIDSFKLPYAYALAYDDVFNYSSSIGTNQATGATEAERVIIEVYQNDNLI